MSPIFVYKCRDKKCKHEQEEIRPFSETYQPVYCEKCGEQCDNIIARPSKMVRGSGGAGWSSPA